MREPNEPPFGPDGLIWSEPYDIELGWLDYNGHLNMAYYHVMFDRTVDIAFDLLGLGRDYRERQDASIFNVETHVVYRREISAHDRVRVSFHLVGRDDKRLHGFQTMVRSVDDQLAATSESLFIHVDLATRQVSSLPAQGLAAADEMIARQAGAGMPTMAGRRIAPLD
ncbi:thioesterase family protein [Acuticoccus sp. I52.16.1]|uniref:thioesterase family protein n=1 Tax=Acuticoccus sp. I52.16.1 TaxID=2928472 RepID=UPI001FD191F9|nr:thioesterase family protein [Acuticoccus sp. I52.16.1]UOM34054.1 thioesterase family protein [Acuticoccus sp. I52.16.1]